eukprot:gene13150-15526_t
MQVITDIRGKFIQATVNVAGGVHDKVIYDSWDGYLNEAQYFDGDQFLLGDPAYNSKLTAHRILANPTEADYKSARAAIARARRMQSNDEVELLYSK